MATYGVDFNGSSVDGKPVGSKVVQGMYRNSSATDVNFLHTDSIYNNLLTAVGVMEDKLKDSLKMYEEHPDVQANLQQLQYDLAQWNLTLTTMTNINKNMGDALNSIAANFR